MISARVSSRQAPGGISPNSTGPTRVRIRRITGWPTVSIIRRICRLRPSLRIISKTVGRRDTTFTVAGAVGRSPSEITRPFANRRRVLSSGNPRTVTR